ncbi:MAG TPA: ABC transporter permease [Candidatus Eisenbacteria bacterium]|jgi:ABC-2 type transport system permease protein|nr:ABC transporter permease [Candidatus Eisenbacteria bacterium]
MSTPPNATPGSALDTQTIAPAMESPTRPFYWSIRRELWEYRSIYIAPLAVAAVFLAGFLISTVRLPQKMRDLAALDASRQQELIQQPYVFAALLIMGATFVVAFFYCLDALQGERRDRSILFWKSLPVSDLTTVLSKAAIALVIIPLLTFAISMVTIWIMYLISTVVLVGSGVGTATLWSRMPLWQMTLTLLNHLVFLHGLWYAPFYCWLLLVSAWARRMAFLWAVIPVLTLHALEKVALNTSHFASILSYRILGAPSHHALTTGRVSMDPLDTLSPGEFLALPGLWIGLIVAAIFLALTVRLRRYREPM